MLTFIAKLIALGMIIKVCSIKFPTFYGGFYTLVGMIVLMSLFNTKVTVTKDEKK